MQSKVISESDNVSPEKAVNDFEEDVLASFAARAANSRLFLPDAADGDEEQQPPADEEPELTVPDLGAGPQIGAELNFAELDEEMEEEVIMIEENQEEPSAAQMPELAVPDEKQPVDLHFDELEAADDLAVEEEVV